MSSRVLGCSTSPSRHPGSTSFWQPHTSRVTEYGCFHNAFIDGGDQRRTDATESPRIRTLILSARTGVAAMLTQETTPSVAASSVRRNERITHLDYASDRTEESLRMRWVYESSRDGQFAAALEGERDDDEEVAEENASPQLCEPGVWPLVEQHQT